MSAVNCIICVGAASPDKHVVRGFHTNLCISQELKTGAVVTMTGRCAAILWTTNKLKSIEHYTESSRLPKHEKSGRDRRCFEGNNRAPTTADGLGAELASGKNTRRRVPRPQNIEQRP